MKRLLALSILATLAVVASASAQEYPTKPVRIIVGFPGGTSTDALTRIYADKLSEHFNQRFIVENMPGAASNTAAAAAAKADADGYTLYLATNANAISVSLYKNLRYKFPDDFAPIGLLASAPPVLSVSSGLGVSSVKELIAAAKQRPGEISYGSSGVGTGPQLAAELFNMMTGIKLTHIPYKGTNEAVTDLLTNRIGVLFSPLPTVAGLGKEGRLKVLATGSGKRSIGAPDLPTIAEAGVPGFDVSLWFGLVAPKGTPPAILKAIAAAIEKAHQNDDVKLRLAANGGEPMKASLEDFAAFIAKDVPKWAKAVEHAGMKID
jgi:tripartite-type tricarboxylate transporter receptor subunit TctC